MGKKQSDGTPLSLHRSIMAGLVILIVWIGAWLAFEERRREDVNIRNELLRQAGNVASTLSMENMRDLSFLPEDAESPAYQRIAGQLQTYSQTMGMHRLYTLGLRDGRLFFGPGGQLPDDKYATPPGTVHQKPSDADLEAFRTGEPRVAELHSDEFGEFVSALVPVVDSLSGEVLLVVGLDMEESKWRKMLKKAEQTPLWSALSIMGLLLLGYYVHEAYKRSPNMRMEYLRNIQISIYFSVMLLLTVIAFISVRDVEQKTQQELFKAEASAKSQYFAEVTEQIDLVLHMVIGFFESSEQITREEFSSFCRHILEGYPIQSCFWLPALSAADEMAFTARMQNEGFPDFSVRQFANDDRSDRESSDPIYPAVYIEPASLLPATLGYDFYSHPVLRETLQKTARTGSDHACMVPALNNTEPGGFLVFVPISHTRQGGFVCFSVNLDALINNSPSFSDMGDISATLFELSGKKKPRPLACSSCDQCENMIGAELSTRTPLFAFGNTYLMLFTAKPAWFDANAQRGAWWTLAIGLILTLLLTYMAAVLINRPLLLAKKVQQRTRELAESKERYDIAISAAEMGVWDRDMATGRLICNDRILEIYGIQPDDFDGDYAKWKNNIHPDDYNRIAREITAAERGEKELNTEMRIIRADGETRHIRALGSIIRDRSGKAERMVGVNLDITEINHFQQALEESRQLLCNIIDTLPERIWWKDLNSRFLGSNIHVAHDAGLDHPDQLIGKTDFDMCWAVHAEAFQANDRQVMKSGKPRLYDPELQIMEDGSTRWIEVSMIPLKDIKGKIFGVLGTYADVTDRKEAELSLARSETKYRDLFEQSADAFLIIKGSFFVDCNHAAAQMLGYKNKEELLNTHPADLSPERQPCGTLSQVKANEIMQRMKAEKSLRMEWLHKRADGELFTAEVSLTYITDSDGTPIIHTVMRDITDRKRTEESLVRLSTAIQQSPEAIVITDNKGDIQYINPAFETNSGYTADEVLGENPRILKSGEHPPPFYAEMWETLSNGEVWEGRFTNKRKNGTLYTEEATISSVRDADGDIVNYVAVKRDISRELVREEELRQAQKMEAVGELAGGVAHDFNNILQGIIGFSELLRYSLDDNSLEYKNADEIHKSANQAAKLTQQLLTFSRKQAVRLEEIDINNVIYDSEALLNVLLGDTYELALDLAEELPSVNADHGQLTQIIMNLAVNARDAMPEGGRLSISTECIQIHKSDAVYIAGAHPGSYLCLAVTDTGSGMDEQTKLRIFDPFFTTKEIGSGTGLGLAVIYGIVQQNNGWINVYSESGKGSCFKIYFPVMESQENEPDGGPGNGQQDQNYRILFVDDEQEVLKLARKVLEAASFTVTTAASAEEGLALFDQNPDGVDLLVSDMILPGMRGDELAETLRIKNPALSVLLISGYRDQANRWRHLADRGYLFLNKPFTITMLLDTVQNVIEETRGSDG